MSSKPKIELFNGNNSEECTAFIRAIREAAWTEGRPRDSAWMADLAALYFSGKAMSWHGKLPLDVRQDWFKLEGALIDRWAPADEDDDSHIQPVPAAAPKPAGINGGDYVVYGVLKIVPDDVSVAPSYVKRNPRTCGPTPDREAAVHVRFHLRSNYGLLELTTAVGKFGNFMACTALERQESGPFRIVYKLGRFNDGFIRQLNVSLVGGS
ncbi:hypothetical protein FS837_003279 [Tulasnella sp. UAMH 9824]|nr:hypothetical protein FS837_003279 [Tulasnella sp. UAMH 9824]